MTLLLILLGMASLPTSAIGLVVVWHVARPQKSPADTSNRINKLRLIWFAMTREDVLAEHLPWLKNDELENLK